MEMDETRVLHEDDVLTPTLSGHGIQSQTEDATYWGTLTSLQVHLPSFDLHNAKFTFGRAECCDVMITGKNFPINRKTLVSKRHFEIIKDENKAPIIRDLSKNGTFVNRILLGKDNVVTLRNNDEIAVGLMNIKVYSYKFDDFLPWALRDKYHLGQLLGKGGYGEVRLVAAKKSGEKFAVKKLMLEDNYRWRIDSEIMILKSLSHPCVISLQEIVDSQGAVFLVLDYMKGGDLTDFVKTYLLSESESKFLFYQIACGVQYLHANGVTHRDLKPGNVLLKDHSPFTIVKITDFGLSKMITEETLMKTICGTPFFLAPEMINGEERDSYTSQVDVWSLGVLLYFILSQKLPFTADTLSGILQQISRNKLSFPEEIWLRTSNVVKNLLERMLTKNPLDRIHINDVVTHPWLLKDTKTLIKARHLMASEGGGEITYLRVKRKRLR